MGFDLETLREIMRDNREWLSLGIVQETEMAKDRSVLRSKVQLVPDGREIVARVSWGATGPDSGFFSLPQREDLVMVAMAEGDVDQAFIISRLSSRVDTIPDQAKNGNMVVAALPTKALHLASKIKVFIGRLNAQDPDEPLVLGNVMKQLLVDILTELSAFAGSVASHTHAGIGNLGGPFTTQPPGNAGDFTANQGVFDSLKASPVQDNAINSDVGFTEK